MIISLDDFNKRLASKKNLINRASLDESSTDPNTTENKSQDVESDFEVKDKYDTGGSQDYLPPAIKQLVAVEAHFRPAKEVAKDYGLHPSSVSNIKNGLRGRDSGTVRERDEAVYRETQERVTGVKQDIVARALDRMMEGIEKISVDGSKTDMNKSTTIRNLSTVVTNLSQKDEQRSNRVQVVIMSPGVARMSDFEEDAIEVGIN